MLLYKLSDRQEEHDPGHGDARHGGDGVAAAAPARVMISYYIALYHIIV